MKKLCACVKYAFRHQGLTLVEVAAVGGGIQMCRIVANILQVQSLTVYKVCSSSLGTGCGATALHRKI
jgi:hypothetical protein